ncbi:MAG: hypothetical protein ACREF4_00440 [Gammaproteobacteria bacterium]
MLRFFRRPPRDSFDLDSEGATPPVGGESLGPDAEGKLRPSPGRRQRLLKTLLAFGILAVGLGAVYFSWSRGRGDEFVLPRLLPQGRTALTQEVPPLQGAPPPVTSEPTSSPSTAPALPRGRSAPPTEQAQAPTFYMPLPRDPRETARGAAGQEDSVPGGRPYNELTEASHEATVENLRAQTAELKLKKLKAELEADELRKNPRRLFKEEKRAAEPKKEANPLERLARVPPPVLPIQGPIPAERQAQAPAAQPAAPPAPPQMRVRIITLEPKEALIEAGDGDNRGWFKVQDGQKFPDFVVTAIGADGVTISFAGRGFFYPIGGYALGATLGNHQTAAPTRAASPTAQSAPPR